MTVGGSAIIGSVAGLVCYGAVALKNRMDWDDALDVWAVHGVGGIIGTIMLGALAVEAVGGVNGLFYGGGPSLLMKQTVAVLGVSIYAFGFSWVMLWLINKFTPVRCSEEEEQDLDQSLHGEHAYSIE